MRTILMTAAASFVMVSCGQSSALDDAPETAEAQSTAIAAPAATLEFDVGADILDLYQHLHANPELSFKEQQSSALLAAELDGLGFEVTKGVGDAWVRAKAEKDVGSVLDGVGGYGVVGVLRNGEGPTILLRADMDALPVAEKTGKPYASKVTSTTWTGIDSGVMHACGHDVHMTSWVGAARNLVARKDDWSGTLVMIAQPAEELGLGAMAMLEEGLYRDFPLPDANIALHVSASLPSGTIGYAKGWALANVDSVDVTVFGVGGHGAYPHTTKDPVVIASSIVTALQTLKSRNVNPQTPAVVTVGAFNAGTKHNIISDRAELKLTVRSFDDATRTQLLDGIARIAKGQAATFGAPEPEIIVESDATPSTYNNPDFTELVMGALSDSLGTEAVMEVPAVMGGEDFSRYGRTDEEIPSLIFWLGAVEPAVWKAAQEPGANGLPSLHSPYFAPDAEATLNTGVSAMTEAAIAAFRSVKTN